MRDFRSIDKVKIRLDLCGSGAFNGKNKYHNLLILAAGRTTMGCGIIVCGKGGN
jgi:hypothetical protein